MSNRTSSRPLQFVQSRFWLPAAALLILFAVSMLPRHPIAAAVSCLSLAVAAVLYQLLAQRFKNVPATCRDHAMLRAMATASRQAFFFCTPVRAEGTLIGFRIQYANASACSALNMPRRRVKRHSLLALMDESSRAATLEACAAVLETGEIKEVRFTLLSRNGTPESYQFRLIPLAKGIALSALHSRSEQAANRRVEELNKFTQSVFDTAPVSIIATDTTGTVIAMNKAAEQLTHYRGHELIGLHSILLLHDPSEVSARAVELAEHTGRPVRAGFESLVAAQPGAPQDREWSYVRRDGSRVWVSLSVTPLQAADGAGTGYIAVAFDVTERKRLAEATQHMAHHDQLTGLLNRSSLEQRLAKAIGRARRLNDSLAVLLIDIDHFKRINDSLGHSGGDAVLTTVADRLRHCVRSSDTVVRMGGDEFVVILPHLCKSEDAEHCAQSILKDISAPFFVSSREVCVTASIGYCLYPEGGVSSLELLRKADVAMYSAKSAGRSVCRAFSGVLQRETADRLEMEEDLRHAIERGELTPHYQPQIACETGEVTGVEMLMRWHSLKRGNVPPDVFLPIAEEAGLMSQIGCWGLRRACVDCMTVQAATGRRLRVAVNLSAREFGDAALPRIVREALAESNLPPEDLELEITEQVLMAATPCLMENLASIRGLGVSLALDDFGTGFSNFSYILEYSVDRLKIDRSFVNRVVKDPAAAAVVRTVITMAHGLGMSVCAEGVENTEQLDFLRRADCDDLQGFLFSRAVPLEQLPSSIAEIHARHSDAFAATTSLQLVPDRLQAAATAA